MRSRLLVLTSTYPRWNGDSEPGFVHELSRRLTARYEVHVLCPHSSGAATRELMDGIIVHRYRYAPESLESLVHGGGILANLKHHRWKWCLVPLLLFAQCLAAARLVIQIRPACVHAHWIIPQGFVVRLLGLTGVRIPPVLLTSHGGDLFGLHGGLLSRVKKWTLLRASRVTVVSQAMLAPALALGVAAEHIDVIPMGVDFQRRFSPTPSNRSKGEILFVGRLVEKKGVAFLLQAMPLVLAVLPDTRLTIAGYGPERPSLEFTAQRLGISNSVRFLGALPQEDLPNLYHSASLFVAPFVQAKNGDLEGFPVALMEAIACQCPLLAGNLEVLRDAFGELAKDVLVEPKSTQEFAERIVHALQNPESMQRIAKALCAEMKSYLDWSIVAEKYGAILSKMSEERSSIRTSLCDES